MLIRWLSFASGIPALIYQVVWTREVSLLVGGQMEAISLVIVAFFGGLALGARFLGALVDRMQSPLRAYGVFEILAGCMAVLSIPGLRWLGETLPVAGGQGFASIAGVFLIFPITFLLGGTTPALLRASVTELNAAAEHAGGLTGVNTAGSVLGVILAVWWIPELGLQSTMTIAGCGALALGIFSFVVGGRYSLPQLEAVATADTRSGGFDASSIGSSIGPLAVAFAAGIATLSFEVCAARMAGIVLGSSLYAWGTVLGNTLMGLALGNLFAARRAAASDNPFRDLARVEAAAGISILLGLLALAPNPISPPVGITVESMLIVMFGVLPPAFAMGAAFPYFVRLFVTKPQLGQAFGTVSAFNTAGGIAGALGSSFYLMPALGPVDAAVACAYGNGAIAAFLLLRARTSVGGPMKELAGGATALVLLSIVAASPPHLPVSPRLIFLNHGRQATAAVLLYGDRRDLLVDGDPEASTASAARETEEYLAILPNMLHRDPKSLLEVGFGSGTTFGTSSRFPLEQLECVEIAQSVLNAGAYFAPDNLNVATTSDPRITILRGDGRAHLLTRRAIFDIVVANTLHPWSLGATGLYSREYFGRLAGALRPGGIATQWLPLGVIGDEHLAAILRSFYDAFSHGALFWGAGNVMLVGSDSPIGEVDNEQFEALAPFVDDALKRIGINSATAFNQRRIADLAEINQVLGEGEMLTDDRPVLEARTFQTDHAIARDGENRLLRDIANAARSKSSKHETVALWLESREARSRGDVESADRSERLAEMSGFEAARRARLQREYKAVTEIIESGNDTEALAALARIGRDAPEFADVWFSIAKIEHKNKKLERARAAIERVVALEPMRGEAWNLLAVASWQAKDLERAKQAFDRAVKAAPFLPEALAGAGGFALSHGDVKTAEAMLKRLDEIAVYGSLREASALRERLAEMTKR